MQTVLLYNFKEVCSTCKQKWFQELVWPSQTVTVVPLALYSSPQEYLNFLLLTQPSISDLWEQLLHLCMCWLTPPWQTPVSFSMYQTKPICTALSTVMLIKWVAFSLFSTHLKIQNPSLKMQSVLWLFRLIRISQIHLKTFWTPDSPLEIQGRLKLYFNLFTKK